MKSMLLKKFTLCALFICVPVAESFAAAGKFNFVIGDVRVISLMGERKVTRGSEVEAQETIVSGKNGMAQLRMSDGAFIAVRADTELRIDKYQYNGKADAASESVLSLLKGTLRTFTGAIAGFNKDKFKMKTLGATIGIRGSGNVLHFSPSDNVTLNHTIAGSHTVTAADPGGTLRTLVTNPGQTIQINAMGAMQLVATPAFILSAAAGVPDSLPQPRQQPGADEKGTGSGGQMRGEGAQEPRPKVGGAVGDVGTPVAGVKPEMRGTDVEGIKGAADPARMGGTSVNAAAEMSYTDPTITGKYAEYNPATLGTVMGRTSMPIMPIAEKYDPAMTATYNPVMLSDGYTKLEPVAQVTRYAPTTYIARYGYDVSGALLPGYILVDSIPTLSNAAPYGYQYDFYGKLILAKGFALDASGSPYPTGAIASYGYTLDALGRPTLLADYALDAYGNPYPIKMPPGYGYTHDTFGNLVLAPGFSYVGGVPTPTKVTTLPYGYGYDTTTGALALSPGYSIDVYGNPYLTNTTLRYGYTHDSLGNLVLAPGFALDASGTPYLTGKVVAPFGYVYDATGAQILQAGYSLDPYGNPYPNGYLPAYGYTYDTTGTLVSVTFATPGLAKAPLSGYMYDAYAAQVPIPTIATYQNVGYMNNLNSTAGSFFEIALNNPKTATVGLDGGLTAFRVPLGGTTSTNAYRLDLFKAQQADMVVDTTTGMSWGRWQGGQVQQTDLNTGAISYIAQTSSSLHWFSTGPQTQAVTLPITGTVSYPLIGGTQPTDNFGATGTLNKTAFIANFTNQTVEVGLVVSMPASTTLAAVTLNARALGMPILPGGNFMSNLLTVNCSGTGCASPTGSGVIGGQFSAPNGAGVGVGYGLNNGTQTVNGVAVFHQ